MKKRFWLMICKCAIILMLASVVVILKSDEFYQMKIYQDVGANDWIAVPLEGAEQRVTNHEGVLTKVVVDLLQYECKGYATIVLQDDNAVLARKTINLAENVESEVMHNVYSGAVSLDLDSFSDISNVVLKVFVSENGESQLFISGEHGDVCVRSVWKRLDWARICSFAATIILMLVLIWAKFKRTTVFGNDTVVALVMESACIIWIVVTYEGTQNNKLDLLYLVGNILVSFSILQVMQMGLRSRRLSLLLFEGGTFLFAFINDQVMYYRNRQMLVTDLALYKDAIAISREIRFELSWEMVQLAAVLIVIWLTLDMLFVDKIAKHNLKREIALVVLPITGVVLYLVMVPFRLDYKDINASFKKFGWGLGEIACIKEVIFPNQNGYTPIKAKEILERYVNDKDQNNAIEDQVPQHIIMIMSEALSDFYGMNYPHIKEDNMPNFHKLVNECSSGTAIVSIFGGGTCNTEYEVLTGNSMLFEKEATPYMKGIKETMPSLAAALKRQGYKTVALHYYTLNFWNRDKVYPLLGIDTYLGGTDGNIEKIRGLCSDEYDYASIVRICNEEKDNKLFLFNVTIQNHCDYLDEKYQADDMIEGDGYKAAEQYLSLVKKSDEAFGELISTLRNSDVPTMLMIWGDHQPSLEDSFINSDRSKDNVPEAMKKYRTPLLIWKNYGGQSAEDLHYVSTNYLSVLLMREAGLEMTPYQKFLYELYQKYPVISAQGCQRRDGSWFTYGESDEEAILEYEYLQLFNETGDRNDVQGFFR